MEVDGVLTISNTNAAVSLPGSASLVFANPGGAQTEQVFTFFGQPRASFRADSNGNLVFNSNGSESTSTGFFYLNRDSGDPIAHVVTKGGLIIDAPTGRVTINAVEGGLVLNGPLTMSDVFGAIHLGTPPGKTLIISSLGIKFPDGTQQTTATKTGPQGPQGQVGPQGAPGGQGSTGGQGVPGKNATTTTFAVCGPLRCNLACGSGVLGEQAANGVTGCQATAAANVGCSIMGSDPGYCCVCVGQ